MALMLVAGLAAGAGDARAETELDRKTVAGHVVAVIETDDIMRRLEVDGSPVHEDGLILLDTVQTVAGVQLLTGVSGPGGNACSAAPFVLVIEADGATRMDGPVDTCTYLELQVQPDALIWSAEPLPGVAGEVWTWTPAGGFAEALPEEFAPEAGLGWDDLARLDGAHPVEALKIAPVYEALVAGLGAAWPEVAERLEGLGSGGLVAQGYRGEACLKFTCDQDFAVLWLESGRREAFLYWRREGEGQVWPAGPEGWPDWIAADLAAVLTR
jgi:hypothetical protein